MDITPTTNTNTTTNPNKKSPDAECDTPTQIQHTKPFSTSNGVLKRHNPQPHHHHNLSTAANPVDVSYKECLKNHAASLGSHALDGCGEFMPSPTATTTDPTSLKCAACGCHRNFHRCEPEEPNFPTNNPTTHVIEYQPHHRHHPLPPPNCNRSPNSASPSPISSSYYQASAPHMLLALSNGLSTPQENNNIASVGVGIENPPATRKRFRTKFSQGQKKKMYQFAESLGWKVQKRDEEMVRDFCNEVGVDKGVLKVWMHNNKNTFSKKDINGGTDQRSLILEQIPNNDNSNDHRNGNNAQNDDEHNIHYQKSNSRGHEATNGSSSS